MFPPNFDLAFRFIIHDDLSMFSHWFANIRYAYFGTTIIICIINVNVIILRYRSFNLLIEVLLLIVLPVYLIEILLCIDMLMYLIVILDWTIHLCLVYLSSFSCTNYFVLQLYVLYLISFIIDALKSIIETLILHHCMIAFDILIIRWMFKLPLPWYHLLLLINRLPPILILIFDLRWISRMINVYLLRGSLF